MRHNHKEEHRCDSGHSCCADEHKCCCCGDIDVSGHNHDDGEQNAARRWIPVGISLFMLVLGLVFTYYEIAFFWSYVRFIWFLTAYLVERYLYCGRWSGSLRIVIFSTSFH